MNVTNYWNFNAKRPERPARLARVRTPSVPNSLDYPPISAQPEYAAAFEKFTRFGAERALAAKTLDALRLQASQLRQDDENKESSTISKAESLLSGESPYSLHAEIDKTSKLIEALDAAIQAQRSILARLEDTLSRAAGRRYADHHKAAVRRLMAAVNELHAANKAELTLRSDLQRLGYGQSTVPPMNLISADDPTDKNGNVAYYWYREAEAYVQTEAELAAKVRRARVDALGV